MKKIISAALAVLCALSVFTACGNNSSTADQAELESLRAENEALKAATETVAEITTSSEITTTKITTEATTETTTEATTSIKTEEEVKSIIALARAEISNINSADGVDISFYWRNNSDKQIKYITFRANVYNAVNDIISDDISGKDVFACKLTGPVEPFAEFLENAKSDFSYASDLYYNNDSILLDDNLGLCYCGSDIDPQTGVRTRFAIPETDYDKLTWNTTFETVMYNPTAYYVNIDSIDIEYMDGSEVTLNSDEVLLAYID